MIRRTHLFTLLAALMLAPVAGAAAQEGGILQPEPIDSAAPHARRARAVAELLLAGDRQKVESYLQEHGAPGMTSTDTFGDELSFLLDRLAAGARTIVRLDGLGAGGVGVVLAAEDGVPQRAVLVQVDVDAPHRVRRLGLARLGG